MDEELALRPGRSEGQSRGGLVIIAIILIVIKAMLLIVRIAILLFPARRNRDKTIASLWPRVIFRQLGYIMMVPMVYIYIYVYTYIIYIYIYSTFNTIAECLVCGLQVCGWTVRKYIVLIIIIIVIIIMIIILIIILMIIIIAIMIMIMIIIIIMMIKTATMHAHKHAYTRIQTWEYPNTPTHRHAYTHMEIVTVTCTGACTHDSGPSDRDMNLTDVETMPMTVTAATAMTTARVQAWCRSCTNRTHPVFMTQHFNQHIIHRRIPIVGDQSHTSLPPKGGSEEWDPKESHFKVP